MQKIGTYDFHGAQNTDRFLESNHKTKNYFMMWNITKFVTFWMNKSEKVSTLQSNQYLDRLQILNHKRKDADI